MSLAIHYYSLLAESKLIRIHRDTKALIASMALLGFGAGNAQLAAFAIPELLPNRWRHIGVVIADSVLLSNVVVGPVAGRFAIEHGDAWRWLLYGPAILTCVSFGLLTWLYFPPKHPRGLPWAQAVRELDYIGAILFTVATTLILAGIVYSSIIPASSPKVIVTLGMNVEKSPILCDIDTANL